MKTCNLKIEAAGDFCKGPVIPKIRLAGQWLERAGFKPGYRVEIIVSGQGILTLRFVDQSSLAVTDSIVVANKSQNSINRTETGQLKFV